MGEKMKVKTGRDQTLQKGMDGKERERERRGGKKIASEGLL